MKIVKDTQKMEDANEFGETLREYCFVNDEYANRFGGKQYGCYSTFLLRPKFKHISSEPFIEWLIGTDHFWGTAINRVRNEPCVCETALALRENLYSNGKITLTWYWDGDGTLVIREGRKTAINGDCKHSDTWEWV